MNRALGAPPTTLLQSGHTPYKDLDICARCVVSRSLRPMQKIALLLLFNFNNKENRLRVA